MHAMQQQHQEVHKAHAFSLDVVTGLRHTLSWQKSKNWKLQKECDESNHRHAEKCTRFEDLIQKAKENLLRSHASEATLREDTERLQGQLDDSVLVAEGLQLELDDERATCGRLRNEVQRLEAEVKTLLARTESAEAPTQLPVDGRHLQSLPPLLHSSIAPFLGSSKGFMPIMRYSDNSPRCTAVCDTFAKIQDDLRVEKERADSARDMYANERDAHVEFKMTSEQRLEQATRERDAALQTSQSSQRELSEIREALGKLSRPSPP
ncbi:hypothetical protein BDN67DRAFT_336225 [Paxillus ammoniavirescens]|nr:hypothetical protein BDN67DRAFT_336225 [Paxillus ammoniavirescens]